MDSHTKMNKFILFLFHILLALSVNAQDITKYTTTNLNMRSSVDSLSAVLAIIPKGTPVTLVEDCDCKWIPVEYNGKVGYVSTKYLSNEKPSSGAYTEDQVKYYTNSKGESVQSPTKYDKAPEGATALCRDGTYSFSRSRKGTCSHHGGVKKWL